MGTIAVLDVEDDLGCDDARGAAAGGATFLFPNANPPVLFLLLVLVVLPPILSLSPASNLANRLLPPDAVEANGDFDAVDDDDVDVLPPPKLNPPPPPPAADAATALLVSSDDAAVDNPEVNDKAFDADLDDDDDVFPKEDDAKPENGSDVVLCFVSLLVAADDDDDDLPAEGSAVMKDEPNMLSVFCFVY